MKATIVVGLLCAAIVAASLALGQVLVAQYAHPLAWKLAVEPILTWPLWAVAGAAGLLLLAVTLKRKPRAKAAIYRFSPEISAGELLAWRALSPREREMAARSSRRRRSSAGPGPLGVQDSAAPMSVLGVWAGRVSR